jgi:hypothetical protein
VELLEHELFSSSLLLFFRIDRQHRLFNNFSLEPVPLLGGAMQLLWHPNQAVVLAEQARALTVITQMPANDVGGFSGIDGFPGFGPDHLLYRANLDGVMLCGLPWVTRFLLAFSNFARTLCSRVVTLRQFSRLIARKAGLHNHAIKPVS